MLPSTNKSLANCKKKIKSSLKKYYSHKTRQLYGDNDNYSVEYSNNLLPVPECQKPSFLQSFISLINYNKAKNLHKIVDENHRRLGPIFKDHIGPVTAFFVSSPEAYQKIFRQEGNTPLHFLPEAWLIYNELRQCKRGLLFMDGDEWLYHRRIMNKLLLMPCKAKDIITNSCQNAALTLADDWGRYEESKPIPELEMQLYKWSIEVMMAILMGSTWTHFRKHIAQNESSKLAKILHKIFLLSAKLSLLPVKYAIKLNLPVWQQFVGVVDEALDIINILVPKMFDCGGDGLLNMMKLEGIDPQDLSRIAADIIIAAGDTTTYSIQWALYLLASHTDVQNRMITIIDTLTPEELIKDPFIKGVIKESLRLYPTAPFITRILTKDCVISNYLIPKGELIIMSLYTSGRSLENFSRPNEFLPERWIRNEQGMYEGVFNAYGSIPFALGARSCVGKKIAETQMIFTLCELVKRFKIDCSNKDQINMILHMISVPSETIQCRLTRRRKKMK